MRACALGLGAAEGGARGEGEKGGWWLLVLLNWTFLRLLYERN